MEVVRVLLGCKANVSMVNDEQESALFEAFRTGNDACARLLMDHGASLPTGEVQTKKVVVPPAWGVAYAASVKQRRQRCSHVIVLLHAFRRTPSTQSPVVGGHPKDVVRIISRMLWKTKTDSRWDDLGK